MGPILSLKDQINIDHMAKRIDCLGRVCLPSPKYLIQSLGEHDDGPGKQDERVRVYQQGPYPMSAKDLGQSTGCRGPEHLCSARLASDPRTLPSGRVIAIGKQGSHRWPKLESLQDDIRLVLMSR